MSINQNLELVIISFTLVNSVRELKEEEGGGGVLPGEIRWWSLLGIKGLTAS